MYTRFFTHNAYAFTRSFFALLLIAILFQTEGTLAAKGRESDEVSEERQATSTKNSRVKDDESEESPRPSLLRGILSLVLPGATTSATFATSTLPRATTTAPKKDTQPPVVQATSTATTTVPVPSVATSGTSTPILSPHPFPSATSSVSGGTTTQMIASYPGAFLWRKPPGTSPYAFSTLSPEVTARLYTLALASAVAGALCVSGLLDPALERGRIVAAGRSRYGV